MSFKIKDDLIYNIVFAVLKIEASLENGTDDTH